MRTLTCTLGLGIIAAALLVTGEAGPASTAQGRPQSPPPPSGPLTWSTDPPYGTTMDWFAASAAAGAYSETVNGVTYTDWRLPTQAELQYEIQYGTTFGPFNPRPQAIRYWSSRHQGNWCYYVDLSALTGRDWWNAGYGVKFVRP